MLEYFIHSTCQGTRPDLFAMLTHSRFLSPRLSYESPPTLRYGYGSNTYHLKTGQNITPVSMIRCTNGDFHILTTTGIDYITTSFGLELASNASIHYLIPFHLWRE